MLEGFKMKFDEILSILGEFGTYQRRIYFTLCLIAFPSAMHTFVMVFLAGKTDYWCVVPELRNYNCSDFSNGSISPSECSSLKKAVSIPRDNDTQSQNVRYSQCTRYNLTGLAWVDLDKLLQILDDGKEESLKYEDLEDSLEIDSLNQSKLQSLPIMDCDDGWDFDTSQYTSTINHQYQLVCSNAGDSKYAVSAFFAGYLLGAFVLGILADWFGRKLTFFLCLLGSFFTAIAQAFAPSYTIFVIIRFFFAAFKLGLYGMAFILCTELVGPSRRAFAGQFINIYYAMGYMLLAPIAYFIRDWRILQLTITAILAPFFLLFPFIPESARWLISRKRFDEAEKIIQKMATVNEVRLPDNVMDALKSEEKDNEDNQRESVPQRYTYLTMFRTPRLRSRTINLLLAWFVINMVYYGVALSTSELGVDHYLAAFVSGAVEIPAYISSMFALHYVGRRLPMCMYLVIAGTACMATSIFEPGAGKAVIAMIGKFCITAAFGVIYTYTAELYPTPIRSMGLCLCSMLARVSGILCPFILELAAIWQQLPYIIFGVSAICSGLLILFLPETLDSPLPETVEQAENVRVSDSLCLCIKKCHHREKHDSFAPDEGKMNNTEGEQSYAKLQDEDNDIVMGTTDKI